MVFVKYAHSLEFENKNNYFCSYLSYTKTQIAYLQMTFLESIARGYADRYSDSGLLENTCFVFPGKRAGTFFLKALKYQMPDLRFAPRVTTISDLVTDISDRIVDNRLDTLFLLHKCYCEIVSPHLTEEGKQEYLTFDAFRKWGETVLSDFNEVDTHLAPAHEIFKNLFDFRSIASTFLTEEQRELMEEYFGYKVSNQYDEDKFWLDFGERYAEFDDTAPTDDTPRSRFIHIWKVLSPLYEKFHDALSKKGLTSSGGVYRLAVERLTEVYEKGNDELKSLLPFKKIVFIGFNALSMSEREIFRILKAMDGPDGPDRVEPFADFVWDCTGPILSPRNTGKQSGNSPEQDSARRFIAINIREFPAPEWLIPYLHQSGTTTLPSEMKSVAAPSKAMEVKIATELITDLRQEIGEEPFDKAKVAMVLPDESLLLPLLYSMPQGIGAVNLTMGYPLKLTSVTSFLVLLRRMQLMRRDSSSYKGYAFEEVASLLGHPYAQSIIGSADIRRFITRCRKHHVSFVTDEMIRTGMNEKAFSLLAPIPADATPDVVIGYLDRVLSMVDEAIRSKSGEESVIRNARIERANVEAWRLGLAQLEDAIDEYGVKLSVAGTMAEAYRLLQGESVAFEGEPLKGLQVMGVLETRALDFEHLVIVSANDRILPRRSRQRSFIPNVIRRAFGLPPVNYSESLFAYYFYRMISRAKSVSFIYDNRVSELTGGPSRYLLQLDKIYARDKIRHIEYKFELRSRNRFPIKVEKTPEIMEILNSYRTHIEPDQRGSRLSASALKRYIHCPLKFYLQCIRKLKDDPAPANAVDAITYGNLIHKTMEMILISEPEKRGIWQDPPIRVTKEYIEGILSDTAYIDRIIHHLINKEYYRLPDNRLDDPLQPDTMIIKETAHKHIDNILRHDMKLAPFNLYGCEIWGNLEYPLDSSAINMTYAIDRVDDAECEGNPASVRIVDYKTGASRIKADSLGEVFATQNAADHYFQLQLYAGLLNMNRRKSDLGELSIKPEIYPVTSIHKKMDYAQKDKYYPKIGGSVIEWHDQPMNESSTVNHEFSLLLNEMLTEIFDPDVPFVGKYEDEKCRFCAFRSICR